MYFHRSFAAIVAFCTAGLTTEAAPPLARLVPEDAALVVVVNDIPGLVAGIQRSPYWLTAMDPSVQRFFAPMMKELDWTETLARFKRTTGYSVQEFYGMAKGEAILYLADLEFIFDPETRNQPPLVFAVDLGENAEKIERLIAESTTRQTDEGAVLEETENYAGVVLHTLRPLAKADANAEPEAGDVRKVRRKKDPSPFHWSLAEGVIMASPSKTALIAFIDGLQKDGVDAPLERSTRYVRLRERAVAHQLAMMVHVPRVMSVIDQAIDEQMTRKRTPLPFDPSVIPAALGLDAWQDFYLTGQIDASATVITYGLTASEERGLLKIFQLGEGPFPRPTWIPEKWTSVSTARFSLKNAFAALEETLRAINPDLEGMAQTTLAQYGKKAGIDIKRDLFGSFGDEFIQAQFYSGEPSAKGMENVDQFYAFSVENAPALTRALDALKGLAGPGIDKMLEPREYLGHTLYALNLPNAQGKQGFSYAVTDRYLLLGIGNPSTIENALQAMSGQGDSYWDKPEIKLALARIPENASAFQRQDLGPLVTAVFDALASLPAPPKPVEAANEETEEAPPSVGDPSFVVDPSEKPSTDTLAHFWSEHLTYSIRDSEGVHGVSRLAHPQP